MKRLVFITTIIFIFSLPAFAQTDTIFCPKIEIIAPKFVNEREETFKVAASLSSEKIPFDTSLSWIIIKDDEVSQKFNSSIIEVKTSGAKKHNRITIVAKSLEAKCRSITFANVIIIPNIGSPLFLDDYSKLNWNQEKVRLDAIAAEMLKHKDFELFVWIDFDRKSFNPRSKTRLSKILNQLSIRGLRKNRVTFMVSESEANRFKYQPVPNEFLDFYYFDEYIMIRGENLGKLSRLF